MLHAKCLSWRERESEMVNPFSNHICKGQYGALKRFPSCKKLKGFLVFNECQKIILVTYGDRKRRERERQRNDIGTDIYFIMLRLYIWINAIFAKQSAVQLSVNSISVLFQSHSVSLSLKKKKKRNDKFNSSMQVDCSRIPREIKCKHEK